MGLRRAFSVAVYARRADRVLMIHHRRLNTWLPIGGELEPKETPIEAARRELAEETSLVGEFRALCGALDGVPPGFLGYEEHVAGSKGLHMNFVFVAQVPLGATVVPNHEFTDFCWADEEQLGTLASPLNARQFGSLALAARLA